ncbi:MAG: FAD-dependent oxidoreductase [Oscillospiraceae bacterium]|nr:FAD-dependent oxidoreductase [Oscillospiraceae bacterium]
MNNFIIEPERKISVSSSCDVLVAGGGIAGIAAALAAARGGKKVTLVEREYGLGGMATLGLITIYLPLCDGEGNQLIYGIGEELLKLSIEHGAEAGLYPEAWLNGGSKEARQKNRYVTQYNPHLFALRVEALLTKLGVTILYGSVVCAVQKSGNAISHVIVENKSGRTAIEVQSVIDCTGDADVCHLAGAKTALHAKGNGLASWYYYIQSGEVKLKMFGLADVIPGREPDGMNAAGAEEYKNVKVESLDRSHRFSGIDGDELSQAVIAAHEKMFDDIKKHHAGDQSYLPVTISSIPLVRMSRRLVGAYTMDDIEESIFMKDSIGMTGDWRKRGPAYELPFGTLYGKEVTNLLAAGRDISVTDNMWDITRVIPPCAVTGEAAGTAAAMCTDFTCINISELQERLTSAGVKLHLDK